MDKEQIKNLAKNPKFISGIYNYCDRWCERCEFTSRCMNYAMCEDKFDTPKSRDMNNKVFWDKMQGIFSVTIEMAKEAAGKMGIDLNSIDFEEAEKHEKQVHEFSKNQPYSKIAFEYIDMVKRWFDSNEKLLEEKAQELLTHFEAEIPGTKPVDEAIKIKDCLEIVRWYQHQIYVKLCRAASGTIRGELEEIEYCQEDADGSAKVAIIGIERSISAWGGLLDHFPQQEQEVLNILVKLKTLLKLVEISFPNARAFVRPGFDT
ncbi:MAG: hypothetical protein CVV39_00415 [Planctomycetes bacterium HGW-Planctomycetes-1]|nr:MAG: hypothetical protein CVV39_00415 [Planctomycetes bacterium HGW-Planctomycetes-1]